ncbi:MAG: hypothetical protein AB8G26_14825, partial [Ilumatobacter sp.]
MSDASGTAMTSDRLEPRRAANRVFPKVRAWFELGAPLELLRPLSVARVVLLVAIATWLVGTATAVWAPVWSASLTVVCVAGFIALMRKQALGASGSVVVVTAHTAMLVGALALSEHQQRIFVLAPLVAVLAIFVGLFFRGFPLIVAVLGIAVALIAASGLTSDATAVSDAMMASLFVAGLAATTAFTARTSRVSGAIDADTGSPNLRGLRDRLRGRNPTTEEVVATVRLGGVAKVRDALGHGAGTELVWRAIEDLGR